MNDPLYSHEHGYEGVLVVNISSIKDQVFHDPACILQPNCHPFVNRPSWVVYKESVILDAARLDAKVDAGEILTRVPVEQPIFDAVRAGFDVSRHVMPKIKRFIRQHGL
jgi:hypothetical protein